MAKPKRKIKSTRISSGSRKSSKKNTKKRFSSRKQSFAIKPYLYALGSLALFAAIFIGFYVLWEKGQSTTTKSEKNKIVASTLKKPSQHPKQNQDNKKKEKSKEISTPNNVTSINEVPISKPNLPSDAQKVESTSSQQKPGEASQQILAEKKPQGITSSNQISLESKTIEAKPSSKPFFPQPVMMESKNPKIAIVIDDVGIDIKRSKRAILLPAAITLSFLPYANDVKKQAEMAKARGHELLVHMPMEPEGKKDAGPKALLTSLSEKEIKERLDWHFQQFDGFIGLNNHMGSKFTCCQKPLEAVMKEVKSRQMVFLDSKTSSKSLVPDIAKIHGVPFLVRDVFLDHDTKPQTILKQLGLLEEIAKKNGQAIAIGHPKEETLNMIEKWVKTLSEKGLTLVPLSSLALPWKTNSPSPNP